MNPWPMALVAVRACEVLLASKGAESSERDPRWAFGCPWSDWFPSMLTGFYPTGRYPSYKGRKRVRSPKRALAVWVASLPGSCWVQ